MTNTGKQFVTNQSISTSNVQILPENLKRNYLIVQNNGAESVFYNLQSDSDNTKIEIVAGGSYEPLVAPVDSVNLIADTGTNAVVVIEGIA